MNDRFLQDLKDRTDLVQLVGKYAEVKKAGKNYTCRSPFRNERTPSFSISPEKQMWYDFGASEGGDAISFVEKMENCSFREALEILSDSSGVEIPKNFTQASPKKSKVKPDLYLLHAAASQFFQEQLNKNSAAKEYAKKRGLSSETCKKWQIGYGGDDKSALSQHLLKQGFSENLINQSGVAFERSFGDKSMMDRFWGRLMMPVTESRNGEIIAFSGRDLLKREKVGKYINSPENPVYHKSSTLFGLYEARQSIRDLDAVVLVEGNLDVILAHAHGLTNVVATCGTALTEDHLRILRRFTSNLYLAFDNDVAGKKATLKSVEMCLRLELNPFIIGLDDAVITASLGSEAKDFGDILSNNKLVQNLNSLIEQAPNALDFFFEKFAAKNLSQGIAGEKKFLDHFFYFLRLVDRPIEQDEYLDRIATKLKRPRQVIAQEFARFYSKTPDYQKPKFVPETEVKFSLSQNFVGLALAFWDDFGASVTDEVLASIPDSQAQTVLQKTKDAQYLDEAESQASLAWQLWQENQFEGETPSQTEFDLRCQLLAKEKAKSERLAAARGLKL